MTNDANKITERKKAVWYHNKDEGTLTCSWCISEFDDDIMKYWNNIPNFCPNCGSEMQWCDCVDEVETHDNGANSQLMKLSRRYPSAQQWIPVSERLPEEKTNVLILADTIAGKMAKVSFLYKDDEGRVCWTGLDVYGLNPCDWQPTHWMPLPEPY